MNIIALSTRRSPDHRTRLAGLLLILLAGMAGLTGQTVIGSKLKYPEASEKEQQKLKAPLPVELEQTTPILERAIDPDIYVVGPGDKFGISIVAAENLYFITSVGPVGDILIPSVGTVFVSGQILRQAIQNIKGVLAQNYKNSLVSVTLLGLRTLKVQVVGAVQVPGFAVITPVDRLTDVIQLTEGLHKYADETRIGILRHNGKRELVSLKTYRVDGNLDHNPTFREGDRIEVPYLEEYTQAVAGFLTMKESYVSITGFVEFPGAYKFFPGYTILDYIGLAGGVLNEGTLRRVTIFRNGKAEAVDLTHQIAPGDQVYVAENLKSKILGDISAIQTITALATLYLTYKAATRK